MGCGRGGLRAHVVRARHAHLVRPGAQEQMAVKEKVELIRVIQLEKQEALFRIESSHVFLTSWASN